VYGNPQKILLLRLLTMRWFVGKYPHHLRQPCPRLFSRFWVHDDCLRRRRRTGKHFGAMRRNDTIHGPGIAVPNHVPEDQMPSVKRSGCVCVRDGDSTGISIAPAFESIWLCTEVYNLDFDWAGSFSSSPGRGDLLQGPRWWSPHKADQRQRRRDIGWTLAAPC